MGEPSGSFDATVFNGSTYLAYADENDEIHIARCAAASRCTMSDWHDYGGGARSKGLGILALAGLGVDAGAGLNGVGNSSSEYLYVVSASAEPGARYAQLRFDQIDSSDDLLTPVSGAGVHWIWDNYPSTDADGEIAVKLVQSAFPATGAYLYLAWKDATENRLFKSIVQKFDDSGSGPDWITRSDDTHLIATSGARWHRGDGIGSAEQRLVYSRNDVRTSILYGLY